MPPSAASELGDVRWVLEGVRADDPQATSVTPPPITSAIPISPAAARPMVPSARRPGCGLLTRIGPPPHASKANLVPRPRTRAGTAPGRRPGRGRLRARVSGDLPPAGPTCTATHALSAFDSMTADRSADRPPTPADLARTTLVSREALPHDGQPDTRECTRSTKVRSSSASCGSISSVAEKARWLVST